METWGLVNYSPNNKPLKWDDKDSNNKSSSAATEPSTTLINKDNSKTICSGCKSVCSIACFYCDKVTDRENVVIVCVFCEWNCLYMVACMISELVNLFWCWC